MSTRRPQAAGFYRSECTPERIQAYVEGFVPPSEPARPVAGVVPHAGWQYSGALAAKVFRTLQERGNPRAFVLLGAVHRWGVDRNAVYASGPWETPLGPVEVDEPLARELLRRLPGDLAEDPEAHQGEHSLEVQVPFIRHFFPGARIVPIAVPPGPGTVALGEGLGRALAGRNDVVFIGSTDLTHYGAPYGFAPAGAGPAAQEWMRENDRRMLELVTGLKPEAIAAEARTHHNACGYGALAAAVAAARTRGAPRGVLLEYTTSHDVAGERRFEMAVGYAGVVF
ncbi:MAG: AmmeMemoRadiSam system protein B [Thermodesulfobacteriota bacterium]